MVQLLQDPKKVQTVAIGSDPGVTDDKSQGHAVGTRWFNTTTGELFIATDVTVGAAKWKAVVPLGGLKTYGFAGHNGAGACTLTGAKVGQKVVAIFDASGATLDASGLFEASITVNDQIQQSSATDLSAKKYVVMLGT